MIKKVLAIETSCDDTSVAVVDSSLRVLCLQNLNQNNLHEIYGGIVPELASRSHTETLLPLIDHTLKKANLKLTEIEGIAVTSRPGLIGSLMVGVVTAKSLSQILGIPLIGVNHLEGHLLAPFLHDETYHPAFSLEEPFVALAVSGGHSSLYLVTGLGKYEVLGRTLDDAAGEAFDKFGKMLGLGFPGGPQIDLKAAKGRVGQYLFPKAMMEVGNLNFSFSGLKSAAQRLVSSGIDISEPQNLADLCAGFQEAVVDVLIYKLKEAVKKTDVRSAVITGGVSANSVLRSAAENWAQKEGIQLMIPPNRYCTDNAAMIGAAGILKLLRGERDDLNLRPFPNSLPSDFVGRNK